MRLGGLSVQGKSLRVGDILAIRPSILLQECDAALQISEGRCARARLLCAFRSIVKYATSVEPNVLPRLEDLEALADVPRLLEEHRIGVIDRVVRLMLHHCASNNKMHLLASIVVTERPSSRDVSIVRKAKAVLVLGGHDDVRLKSFLQARYWIF